MSVFLTGATGYIGGEVLYQLLQANFDVNCLVRTQQKADNLVKATNNKIKVTIGDLNSVDTIAKCVEQCDIIINTADVDHVPSAEVIAGVLTKLKLSKILLHTSGTSILGDGVAENKPQPKVYYDDESIEDINSLPDEQLHRPVDKVILAIEKANPKVKTCVICPSTIYGISNGYDKVISAQVPGLILCALKHKQAFTVYHGEYIWNHIHIHDLGDMYMLLLQKLLKDEPIPTGREGYYFGSYHIPNEIVSPLPSPIEHTWKQVAEYIGKTMHQKGALDTPDVDKVLPETASKLLGTDVAPFLWGTNSRSRANNPYKVGWKPKHEAIADFWASTTEEIDYILNH